MVIKQSDPDLFEILHTTLLGCGVAIIKCDTIYGIVGMSPETNNKISVIKGREVNKPFLSLIPDSSWIKRFSDFSLPNWVTEYWPGPLTLIFPARGGGTVGLRVPKDDFLRQLMVKLEKPLFSTSVNLPGQPPLDRINDIVSMFQAKVDLIVDFGNLTNRLASTIVDLASTPYRIIRQGAAKVRLPSSSFRESPGRTRGFCRAEE